jgi:hypothetical protein
MGMFVALLCMASICFAQSDKNKLELFTTYVGATTPTSKAYISAQKCRLIITQADRLVTANQLETSPMSDLQVASLNLRTCATTQLPRPDRDLAVGLYGEVVSEIERRERVKK